LNLEAKYFGPTIDAIVRTKLIESVEGKLVGKWGFCIMVINIDFDSLGAARIDEDTGKGTHSHPS
jgi:DNA-directed RNA polymerase subunit E'/Rpb7